MHLHIPMYIRAHARAHAHAHKLALSLSLHHPYEYICIQNMHACMYACMWHACVCMYACVHVCLDVGTTVGNLINAWICIIQMCTYACMFCMYVYVCMNVWLHVRYDWCCCFLVFDSLPVRLLSGSFVTVWFVGKLAVLCVWRARYANWCADVLPGAANRIIATPLGRGRARQVRDKDANRAVRGAVAAACAVCCAFFLFVFIALGMNIAFLHCHYTSADVPWCHKRMSKRVCGLCFLRASRLSIMVTLTGRSGSRPLGVCSGSCCGISAQPGQLSKGASRVLLRSECVCACALLAFSPLPLSFCLSLYIYIYIYIDVCVWESVRVCVSLLRSLPLSLSRSTLVLGCHHILQVI